MSDFFNEVKEPLFKWITIQVNRSWKYSSIILIIMNEEILVSMIVNLSTTEQFQIITTLVPNAPDNTLQNSQVLHGIIC